MRSRTIAIRTDQFCLYLDGHRLTLLGLVYSISYPVIYSLDRDMSTIRSIYVQLFRLLCRSSRAQQAMPVQEPYPAVRHRIRFCSIDLVTSLLIILTLAYGLLSTLLLRQQQVDNYIIWNLSWFLAAWVCLHSIALYIFTSLTRIRFHFL